MKNSNFLLLISFIFIAVEMTRRYSGCEPEVGILVVWAVFVVGSRVCNSIEEAINEK